MKAVLYKNSTILSAVNTYSDIQYAASSNKLVSNLRTVIKRYLPINDSNDEVPIESKLNKMTVEDFLAQQPIQVFEKSAQQAVEQHKIKANVVRTTYRPALTKFLDWIETTLEQTARRAEIPQSECAPTMKPEKSLRQKIKGNRSHRENPYSLYAEQLSDKLHNEISALHKFLTDKEVINRQDKRLREETYQNIERHIRLFLGWLHYHQNWSIEDLNLSLLLTDGQTDATENLGLVKQFVAWGINERSNSYGWGMSIGKAALAVAKWKYAHISKRSQYRDIEIIEQIRLYLNSLSKRYAPERKASKLKKSEERLMIFEQQVAVVDYLRQCCAPYQENHGRRSERAIMRSYLRYLVVALLTYCPIRQREIRELELGRTLIREDGYRVRLGPDDNKTGAERDFRLVDILPAQVIADLDTWIDHWRAKFIEQAIATSASEEDWLAFVGCDPQSLQSRLRKLDKSITGYQGEVTDKAYIKLLRRQQELQRIPDARQQLEERLRHPYVFLTLGGTTGQGSICLPYSQKNIRGLVITAVHNATSVLIQQGHPLFLGETAKRTNPHFFRDNGITHERRYGNDPAKRQAFHQVIGNSVYEGDRTYNQLQPAEKTVQAKDWWDCSPKKDIPAHLQSLIDSLSDEERAMLRQALNIGQ